MRSVQSDLIAAKAGAILMSASNIPLLPTRTQANGNRLLEIFLPASEFRGMRDCDPLRSSWIAHQAVWTFVCGSPVITDIEGLGVRRDLMAASTGTRVLKSPGHMILLLFRFFRSSRAPVEPVFGPASQGMRTEACGSDLQVRNSDL